MLSLCFASVVHGAAYPAADNLQVQAEHKFDRAIDVSKGIGGSMCMYLEIFFIISQEFRQLAATCKIGEDSNFAMFVAVFLWGAM